MVIDEFADAVWSRKALNHTAFRIMCPVNKYASALVDSLKLLMRSLLITLPLACGYYHEAILRVIKIQEQTDLLDSNAYFLDMCHMYLINVQRIIH